MTPEQRRHLTGTLESRVGGEAYLLPAIFVFIGLLLAFVPAKTAEEQFSVRLIAALILTVSVFFALYMRRYFVRSDDRGLTWYIPFRKGSCTWHEVTDYYYLPQPKGRSSRVIEIGSDKITVATTGWTLGKELEAMIQQRTTGRLGYDWEVRGARDADRFPYTFRYNTGEAKSMLVMGAMFGMGFAGFIGSQLWTGIPRNAALMGWGWTLAMLSLSLLVMGMPLVMAVILLKMGRSNLRRSDESITVDKEGITWEKGTQRTHIAWETVTYVGKPKSAQLSDRVLIESPMAQIAYTTSLREYAVLRAVVGRYVPERIFLAQAEQDVEDLAPPLRNAADGSTFYHYRTRIARAFLALPLVFAFAPLLSVILRRYDLILTPTDDLTFVVSMTSLLLLAWIYGYWRYRVGGIRTTRDGIFQRTLRGERFLSWNDITDYSYNEGIHHIIGNGVHLRFWETIACRPLLLKEVVERARNCNGQKWERRPPCKS